MDQSVEMLVLEARRGSASAFAELIGRHERSALAVAYALTGDSHAAGDVVQEAFMRAWKNLRQLKEATRFGSWLIGIVRNRALDHCRGRREEVMRLRSEEQVDSAAMDDPLADAQRREQRRHVKAAVAELDEASRIAVTLRYYEGLSSRQIADLLEMSAEAIDTRLSRARQLLRERLSNLDAMG